MIKILVKDNLIEATGHAKYDEYGKDIVCASVSSIFITTVNNMLSINEKAIKFTDDKEKLTIEIIKEDILVKKLYNNLIELLKSLEKDYPKNIKIIKED